MLVYSAIMSLDGNTTDADGNFEWSAPDEEVLAFLNDRERPIGTYLYGRLMYEVMHYWENAALAGQSAAARDFAGYGERPTRSSTPRRYRRRRRPGRGSSEASTRRPSAR